MTRQTRPVHRLDVHVLGGFAVEVDGVPIPPASWPQRRAADLVKLLALEPGHRLPRDRVLDALWPHLAPEAAAAALHKAAHYARRALGERDAVVVAGGVVALAPGAEVRTDWERFEADPAAPYDGELLPDDRYEEWTAAPRERLRTLHRERLREQGRWEELARVDPADEEAARALMRAAAAVGDRTGAVRRFRALQAELADLGVQPSAATRRLFVEVSRGPAVQAPLGTLEPLARRAPELALAVDALEAAERDRGGLLLVTGEAGSGKTALAEAILAQAAQRRWHTLRGSTGDLAPGRLGVVREAAAPLIAERPDLIANLAPGQAAELGAGAPGAPALAELLACAATERGCAVLLDELHVADEGTIDLLVPLARAAASRCLLVIACWQPSQARAQLQRTAAALVARRLATPITLEPLEAVVAGPTRYATTSDGARIAYQVHGDGPLDVVFVPGWVSNVEHYWEMPSARRLFGRLAQRARLILWDKRGTGLSDPVASPPTLEERMLDMSAVMAAAGSERAVLFGVSEGGPMSLRFAAERPAAVTGLVLLATAPRFYAADDFPAGWAPAIADRYAAEMYEHWGTGALLEVFARDVAHDPLSRELFARYQRAGASPAMGRAMVEAMRDIDVRPLLGAIRAPTLVLHRTKDRMIPVEGARLIAREVPGALLVELTGRNHFPFLGDVDPVLDEIEPFLERLEAGAGR
jgi:pimeloyl-ACP methyl ester carboxylesterase/DNA-binding SARP family transcriptional activator